MEKNLGKNSFTVEPGKSNYVLLFSNHLAAQELPPTPFGVSVYLPGKITYSIHEGDRLETGKFVGDILFTQFKRLSDNVRGKSSFVGIFIDGKKETPVFGVIGHDNCWGAYHLIFGISNADHFNLYALNTLSSN